MSDSECRRFTDKTLESQIHELTVKIARLEENLIASEEATAIAKKEVDRRLEEMNELRHQIEIERRSYLTRPEYDAKHQALVDTIAVIQKVIWGISGALIAIQFLTAIALRYWKVN